MNAISNLFAKVGRLALYPLLLILMGFFAFGEDFVRLWAGDGYEDAYLIALLLMVPMTVDVSQSLGQTIMQAMDKYYFRGQMYLTIAIANIVFVFLAAPYIGSVGAAACTGLFMFLGNGIVMNIYYCRALKLDVGRFWREVLRESLPLICFGVAVAIVARRVLLGRLTWLSLVLCLSMYVLTFCAVAWKFSCNNYEKDLARTMLNKLKRLGTRKD